MTDDFKELRQPKDDDIKDFSQSVESPFGSDFGKPRPYDFDDQLPPTEVGGLFLSSVVKRLKADSLPKDSVL